MNVITEDKWNDEVWSAATSPGTNERDTANSNLVFYWGEGVTSLNHSPVRRNTDIIITG